jgi:hypothetical protein
MRGKRSGTFGKKDNSTLLIEFQSCCKNAGVQDAEVINHINNLLSRSETQFRLAGVTLTPALCKCILRLLQRYPKFQHIVFYACPVANEVGFLKQLASDFGKYSSNSLSLDFMPIQRDSLLPILAAQSISVLSLRGCQCLTPYDFVTHEQRPFPPSFNTFLNALATSNIRVLNLYGCHLGDDGVSALAGVLHFNTNLMCLSLGRNRIGDVGARALASALSMYVLTDQETAIVENLLNSESKHKISDDIRDLRGKKSQTPVPQKSPFKQMGKGRFLSKMESEKALNFDPAATLSVVVMHKWGSCVTLDNGQCALPGNSTLTSLVLDENRIGDPGFDAMKEMLSVNNKIVHFSIANNPDISAELAESLARGYGEASI